MTSRIPMLVSAALLTCVLASAPSWANDINGGDDCLRDPIVDWGDAPEGVLAYPGVIGKFPTCRANNLVGTQELAPGCPPVSSPPGPTGHVFHRQGQTIAGPNYWLGCFSDALGPMGIDREGEGKVNEPAQGLSACASEPTDCVQAAFGLSWDQDECYGDGSDAGLVSPPTLTVCQPAALTFTTYLCDTHEKPVYLNVLVDMNHDGDWNDADLCAAPGGAGPCAYEWAVKNVLITLPAGCATLTSPAFLVGPAPGPAWLRLSLSSEPVFDDFPWAGAAGHSGFLGGETEDYPVTIQQAVPTVPSTWGSLKSTYR